MTKEELKAWRKVMGESVTMRMAAQMLGMTENAYRAMERGEAGISKRTRLACLALYIGESKLAAPWLH